MSSLVKIYYQEELCEKFKELLKKCNTFAPFNQGHYSCDTLAKMSW